MHEVVSAIAKLIHDMEAMAKKGENILDITFPKFIEIIVTINEIVNKINFDQLVILVFFIP